MSAAEMKKDLLEALENDDFFDVVILLYRKELHSDFKCISQVLSELHNEFLVDLNEKFRGISCEGFQHDFFMLMHVYEATLPMMECSTSDVIKCTCELLEQAGNDLSIGGLFGSFSEFCKVDAQRGKEALDFILSDAEKYSLLASRALVASSEYDPEWGLAQAANLMEHENTSIIWQAYSAIGLMQLREDKHIESAISLLERSVEIRRDDTANAGILRAAISLGRKDNFFWNRVNRLLGKVLGSVQPVLLYEVSHILAFNSNDFPEEIVCLLVHYLKNTPHDHKGTLDNIDHVLVNLQKANRFDQAEELLESVLSNHSELTINFFDYFSHELQAEHKEFFNKLVTKWLLSGKPNLCRAVLDLLSNGNGKDVELCADMTLVGDSDLKLLFVARKSIGWLFTLPVSSASFILSLYSYASPNMKKELEDLLFEPLLISYTGELGRYLEGLCEESTLEVQSVAFQLLARLEFYFDGLKGACKIKELRAPQKNIEHYWKDFNRKMQHARDNGPKSFFEDMCTVQHLLYGTSSIYYMVDSTGEQRRAETEMQSFSYSSEVPRLNVIDPEGLDYLLRMFRAGEIRYEVNS
ncbi:MAG: hypothetical protein ACERJ1_08540 [Halodesulfovibrio sp.]|uniref:hypothetical protein n=1 Tax=Halodesulfovibrio sp. TaxID=1912772 RepID=UPI00359DAA92